MRLYAVRNIESSNIRDTLDVRDLGRSAIAY